MPAGGEHNIKCGHELFYAEGMWVYVPFIVAVCVYGFSNVSALSLFVCLPLLYSPCKCVCLQKDTMVYANVCSVHTYKTYAYLYIYHCTTGIVCLHFRMFVRVQVIPWTRVHIPSRNPRTMDTHIRSVIAAPLLRAAFSPSQYTPWPAVDADLVLAFLSTARAYLSSRLRKHSGLISACDGVIHEGHFGFFSLSYGCSCWVYDLPCAGLYPGLLGFVCIFKLVGRVAWVS